MDLKQLLEKTVTGMGYEIVDIERSPKGRTIRVFIDKPDKVGGVDIEDCSTVSNHLSYVLTAENVDYDRLEISSPGLDRPLIKIADYERFSGWKVQIRLRLPLNGQRNFTGILLGFFDGKVKLDLAGVTAKGKGTSESVEPIIELDFINIEKARLVPAFD